MMCKLPTRCTSRICCIVAAAFAVLIGTLSDQHAAYAQGNDDDYVDVSLTLEVPYTLNGIIGHDVKIVVENKGSRPAYDVEVVVEIESPEKSHFRGQNQPPVGSVLYGNDVSWDEQDVGRSFRWIIPEVAGLKRAEFTGQVVHRVNMTDEYSPPAPVYDNRLYVHAFSGRVTTSSFESNLRKENNTSRVWSYRSDDGTLMKDTTKYGAIIPSMY